MTTVGRPRGLARGLAGPSRLAVAAGAAVAVDDVVDPTSTHVPLCPFHAVTGWNCPLCGSLRSAYSLSHVRVTDALHDNLLFVVALPIVIGFWLDTVVRARTGRPRRRIPAPAVVGMILVAVVFTVVRNLPALAALRPD